MLVLFIDDFLVNFIYFDNSFENLVMIVKFLLVKEYDEVNVELVC